METKRGTNPTADAAFNNRDVQRVVDSVMQFSDDSVLMVFAREAMNTPAPSSRADLAAEFGASGDLLEALVTISEAGARIQNLPDSVRGQRKGAVAERLVFSLVARRASPLRETHVRLAQNAHSGKEWTGMKDVVTNEAGRPFEVYECKLGGGIEQWELDQLGDVYLTADAEGTDARPCIATMASMSQFQKRIGQHGLRLHPKLYFAGLTDLPLLAVRHPTNQVA